MATSTRGAARCPRCGDHKQWGDILCTPCYRAEPFACARCHEVDYLLGGLCPECTAEDAAADQLDPDESIPFCITARGVSALTGGAW